MRLKPDETLVVTQVLPCSKRFCHDWTVCPYAHPGEKAKRRDPRVHSYTGIACPNMKKVHYTSGHHLISPALKSAMLSCEMTVLHRRNQDCMPGCHLRWGFADP